MIIGLMSTRLTLDLNRIGVDLQSEPLNFLCPRLLRVGVGHVVQESVGVFGDDGLSVGDKTKTNN